MTTHYTPEIKKQIDDEFNKKQAEKQRREAIEKRNRIEYARDREQFNKAQQAISSLGQSNPFQIMEQQRYYDQLEQERMEKAHKEYTLKVKAIKAEQELELSQKLYEKRKEERFEKLKDVFLQKMEIELTAFETYPILFSFNKFLGLNISLDIFSKVEEVKADCINCVLDGLTNIIDDCQKVKMQTIVKTCHEICEGLGKTDIFKDEMAQALSVLIINESRNNKNAIFVTS